MNDLEYVINHMSVDHLILIIAGFLALIPVIRLAQLYYQTRIFEYLTFGGVFVLSSAFTITIVFAEVTNDLIYWQLSYSARNLTYFLFFTHTTRMLWDRAPLLIVYFGVIMYSLVQGMILLWKPLKGEGAGFTANEIIIYSTSHRLIANLFQFYVSILFLYGFLTIRLKNPSPRLKSAFRIMIAVSILLLVSRIIRLIQNFGVPQYQTIDSLGDILLLIGFGMVAGIFYYYPGSVLVSKAQVSALIVISDFGTPMTSIKFEGANVSGSSTLLSGVVSALYSLLGTIDKKINLKEIDAGDRSIIVHTEHKLVFVLVTDTQATAIVRGSLSFFARKYVIMKEIELKKFRETGKTISDIDDLLDLSFPYVRGLSFEVWD